MADSVGVRLVTVAVAVAEVVTEPLMLPENVRVAVPVSDNVGCCVVDIVAEREYEKLTLSVAEYEALPVVVAVAVLDWLTLRATVSVRVAVSDADGDAVSDNACVSDSVELKVCDSDPLSVAVIEKVAVRVEDSVPLRDEVTW